MSGRIPQSFIDDLLARVDIVALIESYVPLKHKGKESVACCPFHQEKTPSFTVSADKQFYHCFGCGAHGTALGFLLDYEHLDFPAAVELLARRVGLEVPRDDGAIERGNELAPIYQALDEARAIYQDHLRRNPKAVAYLKGRGLSGEIARDFALGYAPDDWDALARQLSIRFTEDILIKAGLANSRDSGGIYDRFRDRVMFPIRDRSGRVIGFGARSLGDALPKYLNSPETPVFSKGRQLYGWYEARKSIAKAGRVLVVEGYMDVVALVQAGVTNTVAALGTATTADHVRQLFTGNSEVLFCFDGDRAGMEAAWRAAQQVIPFFQDGCDARFIFLPQGEDPDSLIRGRGREAFDKAVADAVPFADYLFARLKEGIDTARDADRARLAERAKPLFARFPAGVFKALMHRRLSEEIGVELRPSGLTAVPPKLAKTPVLARHRKALGVVGTAVALLIQRPKLVECAPAAERLEVPDQPGMLLFAELVRMLRMFPELSPAAIVERFRDTPYHKAASKLLAWKWPEDYDAEREFSDALAKIDQRLHGARIEGLERKLKGEGLTPEEKTEYGKLLKGPH